MTDPTIVCPHCHTEIELSQSLAAPLIKATRQQFEAQLARKDAEMALREQGVCEKEKQIAQTQRHLDAQISEKVAQQLHIERARIVEQESRRAKLAAAQDMEEKSRALRDLQEQLASRNEKLAQAQKTQAELIRKQRELDDARRELELTVEKRVQDDLGKVRDQARRDAEESLKLRVMEKDHTIASMQQKIEELKQKAQQGSQQLQGEVQELELEALLRAKFPLDAIEPVPKGQWGGDVLQRVITSNGHTCATILWESKRTRNWSDGWLVKLREDQRAAKAEVSILVTQALPKGVETFDVIDGVWVSSPRTALPIANILRHSLLQIDLARQVREGQHTKTEMIYQYLTGPRFRLRVEAIVEAFSTMQADLDKERKVIMKQWAKREEQIGRVVASTVGMYGDLQGIAGKSLQEIEALELLALTAQ